MARRSDSRGGFVLLMTLALIALAAICLAGLARYSLQQAVAAQQAEEELQRRWGAYSCRRVLLEQADQILTARVPRDQLDAPPWPKPAELAASFRLGSLQFTIVLGDEDAKLNLNRVFDKKPALVIPVIRQVTRDARRFTVPIQLSPLPDLRKPFCSWGQVLDVTQASTTADDMPSQLMELSHVLTCWGSGRLNLRRASDAAVREAAKLAVTSDRGGKLLELRKSWGGGSLDELLAGLGLNRTKVAALKRLFAEESGCFSLWIRVQTAQRTRSYLLVDEGSSSLISFAW